MTTSFPKNTIGVLSTLLAVLFSGIVKAQSDVCATATPLTAGSTCSTTAGTLTGSSYSTIPSPCDGNRIDVWYSFVATSQYPTITVTSSSTRRRSQLYSGTCGSLTAMNCSGAVDDLVPSTALVIGDTYYIRVYSSNNSPFTFNICIVDQPAPPSNDDCAGAITLPINSSCNAVYSTVQGSTISSGTSISAGCSGTSGYDVWFKFEAVATTTTVTLGNLGANFTNRRIQVLTGNCGSMTAFTCGTANPLNLTGLTVGTTYYIRVFSSNTVSPNTNGNFSICLTTGSANIPPRYGNSYVNVSKKTSGGVVEPGDTLEVRMAVYYNGTTTLYRPRYLDNVPTHTSMLTGAGNEIKVQTNEGIAQQTYTTAAGDDAATYNASPGAGEYNVRVNLGFGTFLGTAPGLTNQADLTGTNNGRMINTDYPRASGALLFVTAFRVVVTGSPGDTVSLGSARFVYRTSTGGADIIIENPNPYKILISDPLTLCTNSTGVNDAAEFSGTFGSGTTLNRSTDLAAPIAGYSYVQASASQAIGDGQYGIVKNMSPRNGTNPNANQQPTCGSPTDPNDNCNMRMFGGYWDVLGDHTGTNNSAGNLPPGDGVDAGYMLMVNSDNIPSIVYRQSLTNLCPNTYYEFSAWVKNVCSICGVSPTGSQTYNPGVNPNLTFVLDGIDRYSTGEVSYSNGWIKKGFVFRTGATQTSLDFSIRTNSPGGGGNDWAMDDIAVATCLPNMNYTPTLNPTVCEGNPLVVNNTISSFFGNYSHHLWQRSTDDGVTWTNIGIARDSVPVYNAGTNSWEYNTSYTVPHTATTIADSGDMYRVIVATTNANLSNTACRVTDGVSFINLAVQDCSPVLDTRIISFTANWVREAASLEWLVSKEEGIRHYIIEKSTDGVGFQQVGLLPARMDGSETVRYRFSDGASISNRAWYRILMVTESGKTLYSSALLLRSPVTLLEFIKLTNPFQDQLRFEVVSAKQQEVVVELIDMNGTPVRRETRILAAGTTALSLTNTGHLAKGQYVLRLMYDNNKVLYHKAVKL